MSSKTIEVQSAPGAPAREGFRHLTSIQDLTQKEVQGVIDLAAVVKARPADFRGAMAGKQIVLFFEKPSMRTRITFQAGIDSLGGTSFFIDQTQARIDARESIADIARNLERWVDGIVLRTFAHSTITAMAANTRIPVINALSDLEHPCQALADYLTIQEKFSDVKNVRLTYVGDGNNVAHSLILVAVALGSSITVATPNGYEPNSEVLARAKAIAANTGGTVKLTHDPIAAAKGADAIYTDVWTSMGHEAETVERKQIFAPFQVNAQLFSHAASHAIFMHCLPAHRGEEVTAEIIDSPQSVVLDQAENRLHVQKAVLLLLLGGGKHRFPSRSVHA